MLSATCSSHNQTSGLTRKEDAWSIGRRGKVSQVARRGQGRKKTYVRSDTSNVLDDLLRPSKLSYDLLVAESCERRVTGFKEEA